MIFSISCLLRARYTFLAKENKKFQVTKVAAEARNRGYAGAVEWLSHAGIANSCHCLQLPELPVKENHDPKQCKLYFRSTGMPISFPDDETQPYLQENERFGTYKDAIYENPVEQIVSG